MTTISLCCGGKKCPKVTIKKNTVKIVNDAGESITLTLDEVRMFIAKMQKYI